MLRTAQLLRSSSLILITIVAQSVQFLRLALSSRAALSAEVLFLRKQLFLSIKSAKSDRATLPMRPGLGWFFYHDGSTGEEP